MIFQSKLLFLLSFCFKIWTNFLTVRVRDIFLYHCYLVSFNQCFITMLLRPLSLSYTLVGSSVWISSLAWWNSPLYNQLPFLTRALPICPGLRLAWGTHFIHNPNGRASYCQEMLIFDTLASKPQIDNQQVKLRRIIACSSFAASFESSISIMFRKKELAWIDHA